MSRAARTVSSKCPTQFDPENWRRCVSFVPQGADLIHGTVTDNVRYFREWITDAEVLAACEPVGMTEAIEAPQGIRYGDWPDRS